MSDPSEFSRGAVAALALSLCCAPLACTRDLSVPLARPDLAVSPAFARVAPAGAFDFAVTGAVLPLEATPDTRALALGAQATISAGASPVIHYRAGADGDSSETLTVHDAAGRAVAITISVGPAVQLVPAEATVPSYGTLTFRAQNGQPAYTLSTAPCAADGGAADGGPADGGAASYLYQAPAGYTQAEQAANGGLPKRELVRALDSNGQCVQAQVTVGPALEVVAVGAGASGLSAHPGQAVDLSGRGGQPPYAWAIAGADGGVQPGKSCDDHACVAIETGRLELATTAQGGDSVQVELRDALPGSHQATLVVNSLPGPQLPSSVPSPPPGFQIDLPVSGGVPPYVFSYATPASGPAGDFPPQGNGSHGSLTVQGHYTAGPNPVTTDVLRVTDSLGASALLAIDVGVDTIPQRREPVVSDLSFQNFPFLNGQLYLPGLHLAYGEGGLVSALPFPLQRVLDFGDFNGDGLPDALLLLTDTPPKCDERTQGRVLVYTGTINGDVAYYGGGVVAEAAAVIPQQGREPEVALLNALNTDGIVCTLSAIPLSRLAAGGSPSPSDCFQQPDSDPCTDDFLWENARALLRLQNVAGPLDPPLAAAATVGVDGVWTWVVTRSSEGVGTIACIEVHEGPAIPDCGGVGCTLRVDAPFAADLNGDGRTDVAFLLNVAEPATEILSAVLTGVASSTANLPAAWTLSSADAPDLLAAPAAGVRCGQLLPGPALGARAQVAYSDGSQNAFLAYAPPGPDDPPGPEAWRQGSPFGALASTKLVGAGDVDGDGIYDLAVREGGLPTSIHYGSGALDGKVFDARSHRFYAGPLEPPLTLLSADLDRDGREDLFVHGVSSEVFLLGRPGGLTSLLDASIPGLVPIGTGDVDGDGFPDLIGVLDSQVVVAPFVCTTAPGPSAPCPDGRISLPSGTGVTTGGGRACSRSLRSLTPATLSLVAAGSSTPAGAFRNGELLATEHHADCADSPTGVAAFVRDPEDPTSWVSHQALDLSSLDSLSLISFDDLTGDGIPDALFLFDDGIETILSLSRGSGHGTSFTLDAPSLSNAGRLATLDGSGWVVLADAPRHRVAWLSVPDERTLDLHVVTLDGKSAATHLDLGPLRLAGVRQGAATIAGGALQLADLNGDGQGWLVFLAEDDHDLFIGASAIDAAGKAAPPVYTHAGAGGGLVRALHFVDLAGPDADGVRNPSLVLASARGQSLPAEWLQVWNNGLDGRFKPQIGRQ